VDPYSAIAPVPEAARRRRRGRAETSFRYLLDCRLFRLLCTPGPVDALASFHASIERLGLLIEGDLPPLELTPLALLEALGIEPPQIEILPLTQNVIKTEESFMITGFVAKLAKDAFAKAPDLQADALIKRVEDLREKTDPAAHGLIDSCLTRFVSRKGFEDRLHGHLAFDFLYRYRFPEVCREDIFEFLAASLFAAGESVSGLSKVRIIKALWDRSYEKLLKKYPATREKIQALDREMRLKTYKEYLDWEVVHYSVLGSDGEPIRPVMAFTPDSEETAKARSSAYKSALRAFLDQIDHEELATTLKPRLNAWKPGLLVPVQEDGSFQSLISTGHLPVF
jgi:hypothetical protein